MTCPHTSEIRDLLGNILQPNECVLLHEKPKFVNPVRRTHPDMENNIGDKK